MDHAVELGERYDFPQVEGLIMKRADELVSSDKELEAVELYRRANKPIDAALLIGDIADKFGKFGPLTEISIPKTEIEQKDGGSRKRKRRGIDGGENGKSDDAGQSLLMKPKGFAFMTYLCASFDYRSHAELPCPAIRALWGCDWLCSKFQYTY